MRKLLIVIILLLFSYQLIWAQHVFPIIPVKDVTTVKKLVEASKDPATKKMGLFDLSYFYLSIRPATRATLDTAKLYMNRAILLNGKRKEMETDAHYLVLRAELYYRWGITDSARATFNRAIAVSRTSRQPKMEGIAWFYLAPTMLRYKDFAYCMDKSVMCFKTAGDRVSYEKAKKQKKLFFYDNYFVPYVSTYRSTNVKLIPLLLAKLERNPDKSERREIYLGLSTVYGRMKGGGKNFLDSSIRFAELAENLSNSKTERYFIDDAQRCKAIAYLSNGQPEKINNIINVVSDTMKIDLFLRLGSHYYNLPSQANKPNNHLDTAIYHYKKAFKKALEKRDLSEIKSSLDGLMRVGQVYINVIADYDKAERLYKYVQANRYNGYPTNALLNYRFYTINYVKGRLPEAMTNAININREVTSEHSPFERFIAYQSLADINNMIGNYEKSNESILKLIDDTDIFEQKPNLYVFQSVDIYYENMKHTGQYNEVIKAIDKLYQWRLPNNIPDRFYYHFILGKCYRELKKYDKAKYHLLEAAKFADSEQRIYGYVYSHLAVMYFNQGDYKSAKIAAASELANPSASEPYRVSLYSWSSRIDSALNEFPSAYRLLVKSQTLNDSLYSREKDKYVRELNFREEEQPRKQKIKNKELELALLTKNIQVYKQDAILQHNLLMQQALLDRKRSADLRLKSKSLELLRQINQEKLEQTKSSILTREVVFIMILLLIIIIILAYTQYSIQKNTAKAIGEKNEELGRSLEDKEWLLKEMHHRVKNNLHMVVSLLDAQTATLNGHALAAIRNSQHKVFAMSLIYQKIYQTEDLRTILLNQYLSELTAYLTDSFDADSQIRINIDADDIPIDISESVCLALIFDEIISFYIKKYISNGKKELTITLKYCSAASFVFVIDNGWDGDASWNYDGLDIQLIDGLSLQMASTITVQPGKSGNLVLTVESTNAQKLAPQTIVQAPAILGQQESSMDLSLG
jgi:two-component sensor histidine kinase